jgi:hypothetical protein
MLSSSYENKLQAIQQDGNDKKWRALRGNNARAVTWRTDKDWFYI